MEKTGPPQAFRWVFRFIFHLTRTAGLVLFCDYQIEKEAEQMNSFYVFIIRLILGLVFGILLTRIFKPDWSIYYGAGVGFLLIGAAYLMAFFRKRNS
jgi:hypothetical protein